ASSKSENDASSDATVLTKPRSRSMSFKNTDEEAKRKLQEETERDERNETEKELEEEEEEQLLTGPPEDADVSFSVIDREKNYRPYVDRSGACYNNRGKCIGYIDFDTCEAGSASEMFLGCVVEQKFDNLYQVYDHAEELVGYIDMGTATIKNGAHATVADVQA